MTSHVSSLRVFAALVLTAALSLPGFSQKVSGSSASSVSAEVTKGKLSPADSKPGDTVLLKLKNDVKSNGEVVLKKGTTITGVVKNVNRLEGKGSSPAQAQSLLEIEWLAPIAQGDGSQSLMVAVQSVSQVSPVVRQDGEDWGPAGAPSVGGGAIASGGSGLLGDSLGAVSNVGAIASGAATGARGSTAAVTPSNPAMLNMPSVVAADTRTTSSLESNLGMAGGTQLFQTGRGEIVTAGGTKHSLDIFSHLNNDTVLTSPSRNFEISSGARMQLLVGVRRN